MNVPQITIDHIGAFPEKGGQCSTSHNAVVVPLVGGPYNGQRTLVDHPDVRNIAWGCIEQRRTAQYINQGGRFVFVGFVNS